jgi:hypothetical protein
MLPKKNSDKKMSKKAARKLAQRKKDEAAASGGGDEKTAECTEQPGRRDGDRRAQPAFDYWALNDMFVRDCGFGVSVDPGNVLQATCRNTPHGQLWNVAVRAARNEPDDVVYDKHPELCTLVPRGLVVRVDSHGVVHKVLSVLTKFKGLVPNIDEDDWETLGCGSDATIANDTVTDKRTLGLDLSVFRTPGIVSLRIVRKVNGHLVFAHLGADDVLYAGTKNCVFAATLAEAGALPKDAFPSDMVHEVFVEVARLVKKHPEVVQEALRRAVLVGEMETNQHLVLHRKRRIRFFDLGLPPVFPVPEVRGPFTSVEIETEEVQRMMRSGHGHEGWVVEGLSTDGTVLARAKVKAVWYVLARALREMWQTNMSAEVGCPRFRVRAYARNTFLLVPATQLELMLSTYFFPLIRHMAATGISRDYISFRGVGFAQVLHDFATTLASDGVDVADLFALKEPLTSPQEAFFHHRQAMYEDDVGVRPTVPMCGAGAGAGADASTGTGTPGHCWLLMTVNLFPGLGKSTIFAGVKDQLQAEHGMVAECISQDDFAGKAGDFHAAFKALLVRLQRESAETGVHSVVCLHRNNFCTVDRQRVLDTVREAGLPLFRVVFVTGTHALDSAEAKFCSLKGVFLPDRKSHGTLPLGRTPKWKLCAVAAAFWVKTQPVCSSMKDQVSMIEVPVLVPGATLPDEVRGPIDALTAAAKRSREFVLDSCPDLPLDALVSLVQAGEDLRRPVCDIVADIVDAFLGEVAVAVPAPSSLGGESQCCVQFVALQLRKSDTAAAVAAAAALWKCNTGQEGDFSKRGGVHLSADHVTVHYSPDYHQVLSKYVPLVGKPFVVTVQQVCVAADGSIAAAEVAVEGHPSPCATEQTPHVTLWFKSPRRPADSTALLQGMLGPRLCVPFTATLDSVLVLNFLPSCTLARRRRGAGRS